MTSEDEKSLQNTMDLHNALLQKLCERADLFDVRLTDAEKRIDGIAEELSKTNARMDAIDADRAKHKAKLDGTLEEIMEATQETEKAWAQRLQRLEEHGMAMSKNNANLKRDLDKAKGGD